MNMPRDIRRIWGRVALLFSGNALAQIISFASCPILAWAYSRGEFGVFAVFVGICGLIGPVATLRIDQAVVIETDTKKAASLSFVACSLCLFFAIAVPILVGFFSAEYPREQLPLLAVGIALIGMDAVLVAWQCQLKRFRSLSQAFILQAFACTILQITLSDLNEFGLIYGYLSGYGLKFGFNLFSVLLASPPLCRPTISLMKASIVEYRDFPFFDAPQRILVAAGVHLPVFLLTLFAGPATAGSYSMAFRVLQKPVAAISSALRQVTYQHFSETIRTSPHQVRPLVAHSTATLGIASILPILIITFGGQSVFRITFGEEWLEAGSISRWMIWWVAATFVSTTAEVAYRVARKQHHLLLIRVLEVAFKAIVFISALQFSVTLAIILLFVVGVGSETLVIATILRFLHLRQNTTS